MPTDYTYDWNTQSWVPSTGGTSTPAPFTPTTPFFPPSGNSTGMTSGYSPQNGFGYDVLDRAAAMEEYLNNLTQKHDLEKSTLQEQFKSYDDQRDAQLKIMLQNGQISNEQYQQARTLAQQESEFARTLAQKQLEDKQNYELQVASEARQERALQAQLSANPTDWVAYEFYRRGLGSPQASQMAANATGAAASPGTTGGAGASSTGVSTDTGYDPSNPTMLGGGSYAPAAPGYGNSTIQTLAQSLFNGGQSQAWSPQVSGTGAFGANIPSANTISRADMVNMSPTEQAMISGLLKAGINVGGQMVSINPDDYFKDQQQSQVPSLSDSIGTYAARGAMKTDYA